MSVSSPTIYVRNLIPLGSSFILMFECQYHAAFSASTFTSNSEFNNSDFCYSFGFIDNTVIQLNLMSFFLAICDP